MSYICSRRKTALLAVASSMLIAGLGTSQAVASGQTGAVHVAGTYQVFDLGTTDCVPLGASLVAYSCTTTGLKSQYSGSLEGESSADFVQVINCAAGQVTGQGVETFNGSLDDGENGTLTWTITFASGFDCASFFPSEFHGVGNVRSGSGALEGLRGHLDFDDVSYDGTLR